MHKVVIIGSGNVAQHLIEAFQTEEQNKEIELVQVYSRQKAAVSQLIPWNKITDDYNSIAEADVYILCITDDAIETVSALLPFKNRLVVHTSGSIPLTAIHENNRKGVFYPLQTFTKNKKIDFATIPICLESENAPDYHILLKIAQSISKKVFAINSDQRKALHVAAVFANNFSNHLFLISQEICQDNQIPFEILKPLIAETAEKLNSLSPQEAQTGPAKRNDLKTIEAHEAFLEHKKYLNIYQILTQSIQDNVKKL